MIWFKECPFWNLRSSSRVAESVVYSPRCLWSSVQTFTL